MPRYRRNVPQKRRSYTACSPTSRLSELRKQPNRQVGTTQGHATGTNHNQAEDKKSLPSRSVQSEEEILLLYEITGAHGTAADFEKLLKSPVFSPVEQLKQGRKEVFLYAARKLNNEGSWETLFKICRDCLSVEDSKGEPTMQASDWEVWRLFITAAAHTQDTDTEYVRTRQRQVDLLTCYRAASTVQSLLLRLSKTANSRPIYKRNLMLARVTASFQLMESEGRDAVESSPASLRMRELLKYITDQASNPSCFDDVRPFVEQLDADGIEYLAHKHFASQQHAAELPEVRKQILTLKLQYFAATCPQIYTSVASASEKQQLRDTRFKSTYTAAMSLHKHIAGLASYDSQSTKDVQSEVAILAAFCLVDVANQLPSSIPTAESGQYLVQALLLLQQQLKSSPRHSQICLLLTQLHLRLGSAPGALAAWDILAVKRTIVDSLAPLFYDRLSTVAPGMLSPLTDAGWGLVANVKSHYQTSLKMRMPRRLIDAFQDGSYSSVISVPKYIEDLRVSCTRAMSLVESVRAERVLGVSDTVFLPDPRYTEVRDSTVLNEIIDYGSFPSWNHGATPTIYERLRLGPAPSVSTSLQSK